MSLSRLLLVLPLSFFCVFTTPVNAQENNSETTPTPTPTIKYPTYTTQKLLTNSNFETNDFGSIINWNDPTIGLNRWYLVQDPNHPSGPRVASWVKFADEGLDRYGHGVKICDDANCRYYCDASAVQIVPAKAGNTYKLMGLRYTAEGNSQSLYLDFLNASYQRIQVQTVGGNGQASWLPIYTHAVAPAGTAYVRVILYSSNTAEGVGYWDDVQLLELTPQ